jgi:hypothetical protein
MYLFFESSIRGGVSTISKRFATANNPYLVDQTQYRPDDEQSYLLYLDANNLYGYAMKQRLPVGGFRWVPDNELQDVVKKILDVNHPNHIGEDSDIGYMLEVDLDYIEKLHDKHSDLPLCPSKVKIVEGMLSNYCRQFFTDDASSAKFVSSEKLVPNLNDKKNYVLHYRNLQLYVKLEMVLTKTHRILEFRQKKWMSSFID